MLATQPALVEDDPAIAIGIVCLETDHHQIGTCRKLAAEPVERLGLEQGRVAVNDQHRPRMTFEGALRRLDGIGGAELLGLHDDLNLRVDGADGLRDEVHVGADDYGHPAGASLLGGIEDVGDERQPGEAVHHLRQVGLHSGALAGGKDDGERSSFGHAILVAARPARLSSTNHAL